MSFSIEAAEREVLDTLSRVGGGVTLPELQYQTGIATPTLMKMLGSLQTRGEIFPWAYTTPESHGAQVRMSLEGQSGYVRAHVRARAGAAEGDPADRGASA